MFFSSFFVSKSRGRNSIDPQRDASARNNKTEPIPTRARTRRFKSFERVSNGPAINGLSGKRQNVAEHEQPADQAAERGQPEKQPVQENGQELPIALHLKARETNKFSS